MTPRMSPEPGERVGDSRTPLASLLPLYDLAEMQLALCCHDGLLVLPVVADEVADALKQHILGPHLGPGHSGV